MEVDEILTYIVEYTTEQCILLKVTLDYLEVDFGSFVEPPKSL